MRPADAGLALAAIRGLADGSAAPCAEALAALLSAHGLEREAAVVVEGLGRHETKPGQARWSEGANLALRGLRQALSQLS